MLKKIFVLIKVSWLYTIYFNFHYLPFSQAIKLPIFLFRPKLLKCKGIIEINSEIIKPGMIRMGGYRVSLYPNTGIVWENHGGKVIFDGNCSIGNASVISIGEKGKIQFGNNFSATASLKLTAFHYIHFKKNVLLAWDIIFMDTSFHRLKDKNNNFVSKGFSPIYIGENNWITAKCVVLPGTKTPDNCTFGAGSILNKDYTNYPDNILLAGNPLTIKAENIFRDPDDDSILYEIKYDE